MQQAGREDNLSSPSPGNCSHFFFPSSTPKCQIGKNWSLGFLVPKCREGRTGHQIDRFRGIKCYSGTNADAKVGNGRSLNKCYDGISLTSVILSMDMDDEEGWKRLSIEACSNHSIERTRAG